MCFCSAVAQEPPGRHTTSAQLQVYATVGSQVVLPCNSQSRIKADWSKDVSETNEPNYTPVTSDGVVQNGFAMRFNYTNSEDGWQNLTINKVEIKDAGLYKCHKDGGIGEELYVQLDLQG